MNLSRWLPRSHRLLVLTVILFVVTWPLERRKLFFTEYSFFTGAYTEAGTLALYASDLAFLLLALAWAWWRFRSRREHLGEHHPQGVPQRTLLLGFAFLAWVLFRTIPTLENPLSWYGFTRIAQGFLLFLITYDLWLMPVVRIAAFRTIVLVGVLESLLGIGQVLQSSDFGFRFLGEPPLSLSTPGVAKVDIIDRFSNSVNVPIGTETPIYYPAKILRAYGTFPHPNVLGWFLLAPMTILCYYMCSRKSKVNGAASPMFPSEQFLVVVLSSVMLAGILATFSRQAWIGLFVLFLLMFQCSRRNIDKKAIYVLVMSLIFALLVILVLKRGLGDALLSRIVPPETDSFVAERISSYRNILQITREHPLVGVGTGNLFISVVRNMRNDSGGENVPVGTIPKPWMFQYPHNVPVVLVAEYGVLGLVLFISLIVSLFRGYERGGKPNVPGGTMVGPLLICAVFITSVIFDHFPWTIQQGRVLLWGGLAVTAFYVKNAHIRSFYHKCQISGT